MWLPRTLLRHGVRLMTLYVRLHSKCRLLTPSVRVIGLSIIDVVMVMRQSINLHHLNCRFTEEELSDKTLCVWTHVPAVFETAL